MGPVVEIVNCVEKLLQTKNPTCHGGSAQKKSVVMEASIMTLVSGELFAMLIDGGTAQCEGNLKRVRLVFQLLTDAGIAGTNLKGMAASFWVNFACVVAVEK